MAKVTIDASTCVGCGLCVNSCPDVFDMNDDGIAVVKGTDACGCDLNEVASQCPVNCIVVEE